VRRVLVVVAAVLIAAVGCVALIALLTSQDSSQVHEASGPGALEPDRGSQPPDGSEDRPPTSGKHTDAAITRDQTELTDDQLVNALALGNVVITYDEAKAPAALVALQRDVQGSGFDASLAGAGQAVLLARRPGAGVQALAWRRRLVASGPDDPRLREFADAWLGQGPAGAGSG